MSKGWGFPEPSRKFHYFVDGRSLCGKWGWLSSAGLEDTVNTGPDDCRVCARKLRALIAKAGGTNMVKEAE